MRSVQLDFFAAKFEGTWRFFFEAALALPRVVSLGQVGVPQMLYLFRRTREADATAGRGKPRPYRLGGVARRVAGVRRTNRVGCGSRRCDIVGGYGLYE